MKYQIFSGVPFSSENKNVLYFNNQNDRVAYLSQFAITEVITNDTKFINTNFINVPINTPDIFDANYIMIEDIEHEYYFITDIKRVASNEAVLYLSIDIWQSDFLQYQPNTPSTNSLHNGQIINARCVQSNVVNATIKKPPLLPEYATTDTYKTPLITNNKFICIYILKWTNTYKIVAEIQGFDNKNIRIFDGITDYEETRAGQTTKAKAELSACYLVPAEWVEYINLEQNAKIYYPAQEAGQAGGTARVYEIKLQTKEILYNLPTNYKFTDFVTLGTHFNRITFENIQTAYYSSITHEKEPQKMKIIFVTGRSDISIILEYLGQRHDITSDFQTVVFENNSARFWRENRTNYILKGLSGAISIGADVKEKDASGATAGIFGMLGMINDIKWKRQAPVSQIGSGDGFANCVQGCLYLEKYDCMNEHLILDEIKTSGYILDNILLNDIFIAVSERFNYYKLTDCDIIGHFPESTKSIIKSYFLNGIRIWTDANKFLNYD